MDVYRVNASFPIRIRFNDTVQCLTVDAGKELERGLESLCGQFSEFVRKAKLWDEMKAELEDEINRDLGFEYYRTGDYSEGELVDEHFIKIHVMELDSLLDDAFQEGVEAVQEVVPTSKTFLDRMLQSETLATVREYQK